MSYDYIIENINELNIYDRIEILQILYNSIARTKLVEKGSGTQIKISDIPDDILLNIETLIKQKLDDQLIKF
jgi:hypothetical protein